MIFKTYAEALEYYALEPSSCINIIDHPESLERIERGGWVIYHIGPGRMRSPGYPAGNQMLATQVKFTRKLYPSGKVPVFHTYIDGDVEYMGKYMLLEYRKRMSFPGFSYYEYKLCHSSP